MASNTPESEAVASGTYVIDASGIYYKELNTRIRELSEAGVAHILLKNVKGQRYIGDGITNDKLVIEKKIDKLKKKIDTLNKAISLQANKIADTMTLMVISRDENLLLDRIQKKKKAIEELSELRRDLIVPGTYSGMSQKA